jgi:hypothetical protein
MNTCSAHEYTMYEYAQLSRKRSEQRPTNKGNLELSVTEENGQVYCTGVAMVLISCLHFIM